MGGHGLSFANSNLNSRLSSNMQMNPAPRALRGQPGEKMLRSYGGRPERVLDFVRSTIIVDSMPQVQGCSFNGYLGNSWYSWYSWYLKAIQLVWLGFRDTPL